MSGGNGDADAGEAAGTDTYKIRSGMRPASNSAIIGTSRSAWPRPIIRPGDRCSARAVEQCGGAGGGGRVERQKHGADSGHMRHKAATP